MMNHLKYPQKFAALGLVLILPLGVVMSMLVSQINIGIDFARKESVGLAYNAPLRTFLENLEAQRFAAVNEAPGPSESATDPELRATLLQAKDAVDVVDRNYGASLGADADWRGIKASLKEFTSAEGSMTPAEKFARLNSLTQQTVEHFTIVGNGSNLILDPDIDSYYLMEAVVTKLPPLSDFISRARDLSLSIIAGRELVPEARAELLALTSLIRSTLDANDKGILRYVFDYNPALRPALEPGFRARDEAAKRFLEAAEKQTATGGSKINDGGGSAGILSAGADALATNFALYDKVSPQLDGLLHRRIDGPEYTQKKHLILGFSLGLVVIAAYLFAGLYLATMDAIARLRGAARHMVGDLSGDASVHLPTRDELGKVAGAFNQIISELRMARDHALEANRTKSAFLANMSHELRTPLNAIIGYSEMLQEDAEDVEKPEFVDDLKKIRAAGKHLLALINDILDLSKIEAGKMELFWETADVTSLIQDVASTVGPLVSKNHNELVVRCAKGLGTLRTDVTKLRQMLFNLLSNAAKFTEQGRITLEVSRKATPGASAIVVRVTDTGIGMTPAQVEQLFQEFTQADSSTTRRYGGTGLGLAITRRFCQMLGGSIAAESEEMKGTTFTIILPDQSALTVDANRLPAGAVPTALALASDRGKLILVVDDDPIARDLLTRALTKDGYNVEAAPNGEAALTLARELHPALITLDVLMPGMDGWAVLSALKADPELREIPVIMLTILGQENLGYALAAADYLTKPIDRVDLLAAVQKHLRPYSEPPSNGAARPTVLIVEDDATTREMLRRTLEKAEYHVVEAENGKIALEAVTARVPGLILLDLMMPEMDGFTFVHDLRAKDEWRAIPVIVLTAMDLTHEDRQRLNHSVQHVLLKGSNSRDVLLKEVGDLVAASIQGPPSGAD